MDIVLIGTGNTATVLGKAFRRAGHTIVQVAGRHGAATASLAATLGAVPTDIGSLTMDASFYLLAVSDDALAPLGQKLRLPGRLVAHTAGSVSKDVLKGVSEQYGVFYPLQSLRKEIDELPQIPLLVHGNNETAIAALRALAQTISTQVGEADDQQRLQLHLAAVVVNNFTNHLYALAEDYCHANGLDFTYLLPLIKETAGRLDRYSPNEVQTGPAARNDVATIQRHLALLKDDAILKKIYELMTGSIRAKQTDDTRY